MSRLHGRSFALFLALTSAPAAHAAADKIPAGYQQLHASEATATSFLVANWNDFEENYHPNYAFDGDPKTAWIEGKDDIGVGESITWKLSKLKDATSVLLRIRNGYQKSEQLFAMNSRPKKVELKFFGTGGKVVKTVELKIGRAHV